MKQISETEKKAPDSVGFKLLMRHSAGKDFALRQLLQQEEENKMPVVILDPDKENAETRE